MLDAAVIRLRNELSKSLEILEEAFDDLKILLSKQDFALGESLQVLLSHRHQLDKAGVKTKNVRQLRIKRPLLPTAPAGGAVAAEHCESLRQQVLNLTDVFDLFWTDRNSAVTARNILLKEKEDLLKLQEQEVEALAVTQQTEAEESEATKQQMLDE
jgi:hypothetical protein